MNLTNRISRLLEKGHALAERKQPRWQEEARAEAERALEQLADLLGDGEPLALAAALLWEDLGVVFFYDKARDRSLPRKAYTFPQTLVNFLAVTPAPLRPAVLRALSESIPAGYAHPALADATKPHPLTHWLRNLDCGRCQLPEDLTGATMADLLRVYLESAGSIDDFSMTCRRCGLERPTRRLPPLSAWKALPGQFRTLADGRTVPVYDRAPDFFADCPHCHEGAWTWTNLIDPTG
jgi:hypothetical protein